MFNESKASSSSLELDTRDHPVSRDEHVPKVHTHNNIYRYKLCKELASIIERFSIIHRDDQTDDFKEAWKRFCCENKDLLDTEERRLMSIGCKQDFQSKIYTSARYYYKNKNNEDSINQNVTNKERQYNKTDEEKLMVIDCFIQRYLSNNIDYKPELVYNEFVKDKGDDYVPKKVFKNKLYVYVQKQGSQQQEACVQEACVNV